MRIFPFSSRIEVEKMMHDIGVDPCGVKIMLPKAQTFLILLNTVNSITANILKQEMLAIGAESAITRGALTGKSKKTDVLMIASLSQYRRLLQKIRLQPFGLNNLSQELDKNIKNYTKHNFTLSLRSSFLNLSNQARIMGIINLTPDSFSGDGLYKNCAANYLDLALKKAKKMVSDGASIIDLGGQSSRPGAKPVSAKEELTRILPVVKLLAKKIKTPLSIDTDKPIVAQACLDSGAQIINDISGLRHKNMIKVAVRYKAAVVIMHMQGVPLSMQKIVTYRYLIDEIALYLKKAINSAEGGGINPDKIIVDPGIGFGKNVEHNLEIINRLADFKILGKPILIGTSRKSFIGKILGADVGNRSSGSLATCVIAAKNGANILRVHDVKETSQALKIVNAIRKNKL
ncbi:MAG: dihydropteroate synthase [Candidatus Omnitrophica bacterium CG11_big_fil_rev_8_21_14_0_20_41_12]|nr:MAG: dihydropteroate synthase [Candidatus Omnitrophica bacterium CG11_big_fil_rev_8_21_14_0_20_41_12]